MYEIRFNSQQEIRLTVVDKLRELSFSGNGSKLWLIAGQWLSMDLEKMTLERKNDVLEVYSEVKLLFKISYVDVTLMEKNEEITQFLDKLEEINTSIESLRNTDVGRSVILPCFPYFKVDSNTLRNWAFLVTFDKGDRYEKAICNDARSAVELVCNIIFQNP